MLSINKYRREIIGFVLLSLVYFVFRSVNLTSLPIFTDEAIYLRWAQIALHDPTWRFISLTDGKQPLFIWFVMVFMKLAGDPLIAGRLVSVFSGFFTLIGLLLLTYELFKNKTVSCLTGILYVFYPFAHLYDRMALMDGMVGTFAVWGLYFGVLLVRRVRLDTAYTLGFIIGGAALTKSNGFFSAYLLPITLILFDFKQKNARAKLVRWVIFAGLAFGISQVMYSVLRLSPFFHIIAEKNNTFIYTFQEWVNHPFNFLLNNLKNLFFWLVSYLSTIAFLVVFGFLGRKFIKEKIVLFLYFLIPFVVLALLAKIMYPRYIYPMSLTLLPIAGYGIYYLAEKIKEKTKFKKSLIPLTFIFLVYPMFISYQITFSPSIAPIADSDHSQYIKDWPAGWGVREAVLFFKKESRNQQILVATEGTFGLMPYSLELYLWSNPNVIIKGIWPIEDSPPKELTDAARKLPTYVLFYQPCPSCSNDKFNPPLNWHVKKVFKADKGYLSIYKFVSK